MKDFTETLESSPEKPPEVIHLYEAQNASTQTEAAIGAVAIATEAAGIEAAGQEDPSPESIARDIFSTYVHTFKLHARRGKGTCSQDAEDAYYNAQNQLLGFVQEYDGQSKKYISEATIAHLQSNPDDASYVSYVSRTLMDQIEALELQAQYIGPDLIAQNNERVSSYDD